MRKAVQIVSADGSVIFLFKGVVMRNGDTLSIDLDSGNYAVYSLYPRQIENVHVSPELTTGKEISMKPDLSLYFGQEVISVPKKKDGEPHEWKIVFANGAEIINMSVDEVYPPTNLVGMKFEFMSMSVRDTMMHFKNSSNGMRLQVGLKPTQYAIHDPVHGGEVFPQWPEELEERGIPAIEGGKVSDPPSEEWPDHEVRIHQGNQARRESNAAEFLSETEES